MVEEPAAVAAFRATAEYTAATYDFTRRGGLSPLSFG